MRRLILFVAIVLVSWAALAVWQYHEYGHARQAAQETLRRQAESVATALAGGIRFHRRMGPSFPMQLQNLLESLAQSEDVLAVAVVPRDGGAGFSAGKQAHLLPASPPLEPGESWEQTGFRYAIEFQLDQQSEAGPPGWAGGRGMGRGWRSQQAENPAFSPGARLVAMLLLDRAHVDAAVRREQWLRVWVVVAGGLVLSCVAAAWWATVRLADARGQARVLETEARHLRDLSQAAAGLAHETRNPLGLVRGWAQRLAESDGLSLPQRGQLRAVVEECDRITARINQFLAFAKPCLPQMEAVDPDRVIAELAVLLEPDLDARRLCLEHRPSPTARTIRADPEMLRQALFNLVCNAIQFAPPQSAVELMVSAGQNGHCRIEVSDRGPGVAAHQTDRLFTPYFTTRPGGTGLGLAIVRRIAAAHGWQAGYTPRPGGGSVFWIDGIA